LLGIFENGSLDRSEVLLIGQVNVVEEGTFSREEHAGKFEGLGVPELALFLFEWSVK